MTIRHKVSFFILPLVYSSIQYTSAQIHIREKVVITEDSVAANQVDSRSGPLDLSTTWLTPVYGKIHISYCFHQNEQTMYRLCLGNNRRIILDLPVAHTLPCDCEHCICGIVSWIGGAWGPERGWPQWTPVSMHVQWENGSILSPAEYIIEPNPPPGVLHRAKFRFVVGNPPQDRFVSADVMAAPDCPVPPVDCQNPQPQQWNHSTNTLILQDGDLFTGIDQNGNPFTTVINECYRARAFWSPIKNFDGITAPLPRVPTVTYGDDPYHTAMSDIQITACLDNSTWRYKIENLKIPLFSSFCPPDNAVDLGDGTDQTLLARYIKTYEDWLDVDYFLQFHMGQFAPTRIIPYNRVYSFKRGVEDHELKHRGQHGLVLEKKFNTEFNGIFNINYTVSQQPCQTWAILDKKDKIKESLQKALRNALGEIKKQEEDPEKKWENAAIRFSRPTYERIQERIINWAKNPQHAWWPRRP